MRRFIPFMLPFMLVVAVALFCGAARANAQAAGQACQDSALPEGVRATLASQFADWRVQTPADLEPDYQKEWMAKHSAACPGIASGQFDGKSSLSYALLLIPRQKGRQGYRLVVFAAASHDAFSPIVLEQSDAYVPTGTGVYRIDPGLQFNEEKFSTFKLKSDGIYLETKDQPGFIYYWKRGHYQRVLESD
jgi:hypothetical protein